MLKERELARVSTGFPSEVLTVSALNRSVRDLIEHRLPLIWVGGEISNLTLARSGHTYFSLKDESAQVRCVMFRHRGQHLDWTLCDGMKVEVQALVTLYEARGDFQLNVEGMRRAGTGALYEAFVKLRDRLRAEGLFATEAKRPLPDFPRQVGVVTSLDAAALRDVLTALKRRNRSISVVIYPAPVQGGDAAEKLSKAIECAGARAECDVLVLTRGGGSLEDLWAFNDERLARTIRASPIPIVTGIGHESDYTIADLAADVRAPTPTAAAELVSPARDALTKRIREFQARNRIGIARTIELRMQSLDQIQRRVIHPGRRLDEQGTSVEVLRERLSLAATRCYQSLVWKLQSVEARLRVRTPEFSDRQRMVTSLLGRIILSGQNRLAREQTRIHALSSNLDHLGPSRVMERGYSIVRNKHGGIVSNSQSLRPGDSLAITFAIGSAQTRIESTD